MKKLKSTLTIFAITTLVLGMNLSSCSSAADDVTDAKEDVDSANKELDQAKEDLKIDMEVYRQETIEKILENENAIAEKRKLIETDKSALKAAHQKQIIDLEARNKELKDKLENYKGEGKENWEEFKKEFSHDMTEIGDALKDLTVNNTK
jgi:chromosome segregation ATPase